MLALLSLALLLLMLAALPAPAAVHMYQWVNDMGVTNYDDFLTIPHRFKSKAVPLGYRNASAPPPGAAPPPAGAVPSSLAGPPVVAGSTTVRYVPGQRILVDGRLNGRSPARLLLDTGADRTLINS